MVKAKSTAITVACFSLLVAILTFCYGYHRERVNSMNRLKNNALLMLEKSSVSGNWAYELVDSNKQKEFLKSTITASNDLSVSGQASSLDGGNISDITGSERRGGVFMRFARTDNSDALNLFAYKAQEYCIAGTYHYDSGKTGKFVGLKYDGPIDSSKVEGDIRANCGLPN